MEAESFAYAILERVGRVHQAPPGNTTATDLDARLSQVLEA